eukprot:3717204-Amphidinium_carterae.1
MLLLAITCNNSYGFDKETTPNLSPKRGRHVSMHIQMFDSTSQEVVRNAFIQDEAPLLSKLALL